jgi:hypothetical protein
MIGTYVLLGDLGPLLCPSACTDLSDEPAQVSRGHLRCLGDDPVARVHGFGTGHTLRQVSLYGGAVRVLRLSGSIMDR